MNQRDGVQYTFYNYLLSHKTVFYFNSKSQKRPRLVSKERHHNTNLKLGGGKLCQQMKNMKNYESLDQLHIKLIHVLVW